MRAALESLLRARKLDGTLLQPLAPRADQLAPTGAPDVDAVLGGGLRRGHLSELIGAASSGRSTVVAQALASATRDRGEAAAIVDACDTFDPASASTHGVALPHLLWVRDCGDAVRAIKAFSLILQAGGFGVVVLDVAAVPMTTLRRVPWTTWMRLARIVEGRDAAALVVASERIARSAGGATIVLDQAAVRWQGHTPRARVFAGLVSAPRVTGAR
ncbi:MAG TPA: hypothetical protein VGL62_09540 [Vicinamibacterales bacterium]|jgi:hypothetical protein